ncbi:WD40 repeat-like protein [Viridothelium virens]|uniref:WD40 repeat-like protein n=1 Tax=Viridothelium virens TaxID=1048519 RepID=A0A6A6GXU6_VIRVR|nr:WD40 repeat-like protein [Viridothelium virens]
MSIFSDAIWAASPTATRGSPTVLSSDSKGERITYASNKSIFVRNIDDPAISRQYTQHTTQTTVARFSPSGFYVASGDVSGSVRIWDCVGEGATKGEYHIIAGRINDIAWDGDSQRVIAVGDGKERFGHCITADSGNSVGEISGHSSQINCVSIRQQRPLRAATGSDDTSLVFLHGAPFKFNTSLRDMHNRFIYGVQFSPDGTSLVSVGADKRIWLYDGKTGESKVKIGEGIHTGSIFGVSWAKDSKRFVTASADQTVRIWDAEAGKAVQTWRLGEEGVVSIPDQQVGITWPSGRSDGLVISVDLEGNLNYLTEGSPKPSKVVRGHQKNVTAATISDKTFWTGSYEGRVCAWDVTAGSASKIDSESHTNYVSSLAASPSHIHSVGWDDTLRTIDIHALTFSGSLTKLSGQPRSIAVSSNKTFVATPSSIEILSASSGEQLASIPSTKGAPIALAAHADLLAVGYDDKQFHIYTVTSSNTLTPVASPTDLPSPVTALAFSPDGTKLAAGTTAGKLAAYGVPDFKLLTSRWTGHTARVTSVAWSADGEFAVSGSLDTNLFVWSLADPGKRIKASNAHKEGVNGVAWVDGGREEKGSRKVVSSGGDAAVKVWRVEKLG